jgi:hypothetical protein
MECSIMLPAVGARIVACRTCVFTSADGFSFEQHFEHVVQRITSENL